MRALILGLLAAGCLAAAPGAQAPGAAAWVSCRVVPPSTLQLIWHGAAHTALYHLEITRIPPRGAARSVTTTVTTADTTWTQAGLPPGALRIRVLESGRDYLAISLPVAGDQPVACRSAREP